MIKTCERCRKNYETSRPNSLFCPDCRIVEWRNRRREQARLARQQARERKQILRQQKVDESIGQPTKTLSDWCREAAECNLDYGTYRMLVEL